MKILLCYAYADLNKGDSAICLGAKEFLSVIYPEATIELLNFSYEGSYYGEITKNYYQSLGDNVIERPKVGDGKLGVLKNIVVSKDKHNLKEVISKGNYDLVVMNGGHFVYSKASSLLEKIKNDLRLEYVFSPLYAAKELGIKAGILGQSIGPINSDKKCIDILKKADFVITRENISSVEVNEALGEDKALPNIDLAFFMNTKTDETSDNNNKFIALNLRKVVASGGLELDSGEYLEQFKDSKCLVDYILDKTEEKVCLFSQVKGFKAGSGENDEDIHNEFKDKYYKDNDRVFVKHIDSSEASIIEFYRRNCSLLVSTRFHGLIFSMLAGIPSIAYNVNGVGNKIVGLYHDLGLENFVFDSVNTKVSLVDIFKNLKNYPDANVISSGIANKKSKIINDFKVSVEKSL